MKHLNIVSALCSALLCISFASGMTASAYPNASALFTSQSFTCRTWDQKAHICGVTSKTMAELTIPSHIQDLPVTRIERSAFEYYTNLQSLTLPDTLASVGSYAFFQCSKLTELDFPASVVHVVDDAFFGCSSLRSITFRNPECEIDAVVAEGDSVSEFAAAFKGVIRGYAGSTAEDYAKRYGLKFESLGTAPGNGDLDNDQSVTSADAQTALIAYAELVAGNPGNLTQNQRIAADVNMDGQLDVADAQIILQYYVLNTLSGLKHSWNELTGMIPSDAYQDWREAYLYTLANTYNLQTNSATKGYSLADIDKDGTPELITSLGDAFVDGVNIYTFKRNRNTMCKFNPLTGSPSYTLGSYGMISVHPEGQMVSSGYTKMGATGATYYEFTGTEFRHRLSYSYNFEAAMSGGDPLYHVNYQAVTKEEFDRVAAPFIDKYSHSFGEDKNSGSFSAGKDYKISNTSAIWTYPEEP